MNADARHRARLERGRIEDALTRAGWPWLKFMSAWLDELVAAEERAA